MPWVPVEVHQYLGGMYCPKILGRRTGQLRNEQQAGWAICSELGSDADQNETSERMEPGLV
jgi:hypothetical protein